MSAVLAAIAAFLALAILLLAVPVELVLRLQGIESIEGHVAVRWLFGLVRVRVRRPDSSRASLPDSADRPVHARTRSKPEDGGRRRAMWALWRQAAFRERAVRFARDVLRAIHPQQLGLRLRLGLGDPADTGRLWALVGPLAAVAQALPHAEVRVEPEFLKPALEFETQGRLRVVPLQVLALVAAFVLSPPSIRAWRTLWAANG